MELIYLYIRKYENLRSLSKKMKIEKNIKKNFIIENIGINFSDSFNCSFDKETGLKIEKVTPFYKGFYGENIKSLKVLAGKNGSGKTTILDILGMTREERCRDHLTRDNRLFTAEYFMIYHIEGDQFIIEITANITRKRKSDCWIKNLDLDSVFRKEMNMNYKLPIGYTFTYDFSENILKAGIHLFEEYKFEIFKEKKIAELVNIYYFSQSFSHRKTRSLNYKRREERDDTYLLKRQDLEEGIFEPNDYLSIYEILFDPKYEYFKAGILKTDLLIQMNDTYSSEFSLDGEFFKLDDNSIKKEKIKKIKRKIDEIEKELYIKSGLKSPRPSIFLNAKSKNNEEVNASNERINYKHRYLKSLSIRYILNALNAVIKFTYEEDSGNSLDEEFGRLKPEEVERYLELIDKNEYEVCKKTVSVFKEIADFELIRTLIWENEDNINDIQKIKKIYDFELIRKIIYRLKDIRKSVFKQIEEEFKECDDFKETLTNNILLGRYLLLRIDSINNLGKDNKYQVAFEEIFCQLCKLDESYFYEYGLIIDSRIHTINKTISELFKDINKWYTYKSDFYNDVWGKFTFSIPYVSDGERCMLDIFSKFINVLGNEERALHVILMDEPDQRLHPNWSRQFIQLLTHTIKTLNDTIIKTKGESLNVQLVISTHSTFLLSDIRKQDLILLKPDTDNSGAKRFNIELNNFNTFAANLHDIVKKSFFLDDTIGEFAKLKIEKTCKKVFGDDTNEGDKPRDTLSKRVFNDKSIFQHRYKNREITDEDIRSLEYLIDQISEPIFKKSLEKELEIRQQWLKEIKNEDEKVEEEVQVLLNKFSMLDNEKKASFIKGLINKCGVRYD
ncbi:hypothetical protein EHE19_001050 [Ruminiclostridium herbifermentans]|uniref:ATPase AAA-type core domain-containing protein n=1 Tax=Ruminiclostridium herbifermentans TaxID=2488810 RepID=A0A4U7JIM6_9FIRM|nr:ATP-binding protein [Ruminiclostridium herbifermentans]QNU67174.1 hypothetical protein EHE19_001050 [Ruminiclostridium herbifermentans]